MSKSQRDNIRKDVSQDCLPYTAVPWVMSDPTYILKKNKKNSVAFGKSSYESFELQAMVVEEIQLLFQGTTIRLFHDDYLPNLQFFWVHLVLRLPPSLVSLTHLFLSANTHPSTTPTSAPPTPPPPLVVLSCWTASITSFASHHHRYGMATPSSMSALTVTQGGATGTVTLVGHAIRCVATLKGSYYGKCCFERIVSAPTSVTFESYIFKSASVTVPFCTSAQQWD